jgi:hypothetical protein
MRIGNTQLNENESEWCQNKSKEILTHATKDIVTALNKQLSEEDVAGLLKHLWSTKTVSHTEEPVEDDNGDDIE